MPITLKTLSLALRRLKYVLIFVSFAAVATACSMPSAIAGSGLLSSVGGVTFIQGANHFWVSQARPTFSGITSTGNNVDVTIGGNKNGVAADSSGNWSFTPVNDLSADNQVTIATSETSITFTLTVGALPENIASSAGSTLSPAGSVNPTLFILGGGISLFLIGVFGLRRT